LKTKKEEVKTSNCSNCRIKRKQKTMNQSKNRKTHRISQRMFGLSLLLLLLLLLLLQNLVASRIAAESVR